VSIRYSTLFKFVLVVGIVGALAWVIWQGYCSTSCKSAIKEADRLASKGNVREALYEIDEADGLCDCLTHYGGDASREYTRIQELLRRYARARGEAAAFDLARNASGPILSSLSEE
jgi:hypothetical protein